MTDSIKDELIVANQILVQQDVLDAFGHISVRHPFITDRFLLSSALAPILVQADDILEFNLDSTLAEATKVALYIERFIHGSIYRTRPDIQAICHHHAPAVMPFCVTGVPLVPVSQTGVAMGAMVPFWDSRDEFGDTNLLVANQEQGDSIARALGNEWMVLMRRHGACVVGQSLRELVFRAVYACQDAKIQYCGQLIGDNAPVSTGELSLVGHPGESAINRAWDHWVAQLPPKITRM